MNFWSAFGFVLTFVGAFLAVYTFFESKQAKETNALQYKSKKTEGTSAKNNLSLNNEKRLVIKHLWWSSIIIILAGLLSLGLSYTFPTSPENNSSPGSGTTHISQNILTPTNSTTSQISAALTATATARAQGIYEAEDLQNTILPGAYVEKCPSCSNGWVVFNIGVAPNRSPGTLQFNNVFAAKAGSYWMIVTYCAHYSSDNYAYVSVNGEPAFKIHYLPAGDCLRQNAKLGNLFVSISLREGNNTIKFSNPYDYSSYIDKITIQSINP